MKNIYFLLALLMSTEAFAKECSPQMSFNPGALNKHNMINFRESYQGKVILIVNTASKCVYTDQYSALEQLYREYRHEGFVILDFPSSYFDQQEPAEEEQIKRFSRLTYGIEYSMFAKTHVFEWNANPFYTELAGASGNYSKWNFHKYLIARKGELVTDYSSAIDPVDESFIQEMRNQVRRF